MGSLQLATAGGREEGEKEEGGEMTMVYANTFDVTCRLERPVLLTSVLNQSHVFLDRTRTDRPERCIAAHFQRDPPLTPCFLLLPSPAATRKTTCLSASASDQEGLL
jgi:hypothetical protein